MDQSNFQKDMIESEEAFIEQFDRNSANFHQGNPTVVPVGGQRIPESMPTMYPEQDLQNYLNPQEQDFGPEYKLLMQYKEVLDLLKKSLNKISAHHEALLRNQENLKKSENQVQIQKFQGLIDTEKANLKNTIQQLEGHTQFILQQDRFQNKYNELLQILSLAYKSYNSKEELFEFGTLIKNMTSLIFKDNQKLTEDIKLIKKQKK
ncbi:unnamed protein product [Paramecium primaurelia]|uniref:Uncharacterized protein n=1 Tax=Paramecium primaurelia TaxID=5886 RepID=A0A8S1M5S7_PARPR|nr:unnamed protein product [Paramecium primaurelia]